MIIAPTPCYFTVLARGEGAAALMLDLCPEVAADIEEVKFLSEDYDSDIDALHKLDWTISYINGLIHGDVKEQFNPLYIPSKIEDVDSMLEINPRSDALRFTGFNGDPFTLKMVDVKRDEEELVKLVARYHPFELPHYTEIVDAHENFQIN